MNEASLHKLIESAWPSFTPDRHKYAFHCSWFTSYTVEKIVSIQNIFWIGLISARRRVEYAFRILLEAILYIITYNSANSWNSLSALYSSLKNRNSNENHRIFEVQISQCTLDVTLEAAYFFRSNIESSRGHVCNLQTTKIVVVSKRPCRCCPFISAVTAVVHWERLWAVRSTR